MKVHLIGPGAVGTLIGGLLRLNGHDVTLVGKSAEKQPAAPLRIIHPSGWMQAEGLRFVGPEAARDGAEAWIVTLARHHLHGMRRPDFTRLTGGGDGPVFFFNCDPAEPERLALPPERTRFGVTLLSAVRLQEGEVELAAPDPVLIVEKGPESDTLFKGLGAHGFRVLAVDDALPSMWSFFVFQLLFLPVALCNLTLPAFLASADGREVAGSIIREGLLTMEKLDQPLAPLPVMDPRDLLQRIEKKPTAFESAKNAPDRSYNSILQALLTDRPVEATYLNRRLVEMASSAGVHLTWNWRVLQKAGRVTSLGFYKDPGELLRSLA